MAFIQASASVRERTGKLLSADNGIPERHVVIDMLRKAAPRLGLGASVIATLDTMLSCLPPKRNHHTVFASNATLTFRRNGISERTIRRHAAALQEAGLLARHDSPNRKRFARRNMQDGKALRFGFDLSPLYERLAEIAQHAADVMQEREQIAYLRTKIRAAANTLLSRDPDHVAATSALRALRRKLTAEACEALLADLAQAPLEAEAEADTPPHATQQMSGTNGQNVRHHHNSKKEHIDKTFDTSQENTPPLAQPLSLSELLTACPEAVEFSLRKIETISDAIAHGRMLAPMIGINAHAYQQAQDRLGGFRTAATVWALMQVHDKIQNMGAYFRAITTGARHTDFDPEAFVRRLARSGAAGA